MVYKAHCNLVPGTSVTSPFFKIFSVHSVIEHQPSNMPSLCTQSFVLAFPLHGRSFTQIPAWLGGSLASFISWLRCHIFVYLISFFKCTTPVQNSHPLMLVLFFFHSISHFLLWNIILFMVCLLPLECTFNF